MAERIGSGRRFRGLEAALTKPGVRDPAALAAAIGRRKYGKERFQELAKHGKDKAAKGKSTRTKRVRL